MGVTMVAICPVCRVDQPLDLDKPDCVHCGAALLENPRPASSAGILQRLTPFRDPFEFDSIADRVANEREFLITWYDEDNGRRT